MRRTLVDDLFDAVSPVTDHPYTDEDIAGEIAVFLVAGATPSASLAISRLPLIVW